MLRFLLFLLSLLLAVFPAAAQTNCALPSRLQVGEAGRVLYTDGDPLNVRAQPGTGSPVVGRLPEGADFVVEDGPTCAGGIQWWKVQGDGARGWVAEGLDGAYFVEFLTNGGWDKDRVLKQQLQAASLTAGFIVRDTQGLRLTDAAFQTIAALPAGRWRAVPGGVSIVRRGDSAGLFAAYLDGTTWDIAAPPVEGRFFLDARPAPDRQQIAWLYEDCDSSQYNCDGRQVYTLVFTDGDGNKPQEIWRESYHSDATELFISGWRDDSGAVFLNNTSAFACPEPGTPPGEEPVYCPGSSATMEVMTDGTAGQRIPVNLDGAISPDGAWVAYDTGERYRRQVEHNELQIAGRDGAAYSLPFPASSRIYHLTFAPDSAYLTWIEVTFDASYREVGAELKAADLSTGQAVTLRAFEHTFPEPSGWLTDTWLLVNVKGHLLVTDVSTGAWAAFPPVPEGGYITGVVRP